MRMGLFWILFITLLGLAKAKNDLTSHEDASKEEEGDTGMKKPYIWSQI